MKDTNKLLWPSENMLIEEVKTYSETVAAIQKLKKTNPAEKLADLKSASLSLSRAILTTFPGEGPSFVEQLKNDMNDIKKLGSKEFAISSEKALEAIDNFNKGVTKELEHREINQERTINRQVELAGILDQDKQKMTNATEFSYLSNWGGSTIDSLKDQLKTSRSTITNAYPLDHNKRSTQTEEGKALIKAIDTIIKDESDFSRVKQSAVKAFTDFSEAAMERQSSYEQQKVTSRSSSPSTSVESRLSENSLSSNQSKSGLRKLIESISPFRAKNNVEEGRSQSPSTASTTTSKSNSPERI